MGFMLNDSLNMGIRTLKNMDYDGILGVETASGYWGLSTFNTDFAIALFNNDTLSNEGYFVDCGFPLLFVPAVNTDNVVHLSEHLCITDPEQTVVDMVRYKRHEFHLFETLVSAIDEEQVNVERLNELARQYDVYDTMYSQLEEALECVGEG